MEEGRQTSLPLGPGLPMNTHPHLAFKPGTTPLPVSQADDACDGFSFSSERMKGGSGSGCGWAYIPGLFG